MYIYIFEQLACQGTFFVNNMFITNMFQSDFLDLQLGVKHWISK